MAELLLITPEADSTSIPLGDQPVFLGRSVENRLSFPKDSGLSRKHLLLRQDAGCWTVIDLGSKNGTFVNGARISGKHRLRPGDRISAGAQTMIFNDLETSEATVVFQPPFSGQPDMSTKIVSLREVLSGTAPDALSAAAEQPSAPRERALWAFVRVVRELAVRRPLADLFRLILELSLEAVDADRGVLLTLDDSGRLAVQASRGGEFRISATARNRVLNEGASLLVQDVLDDETWLASTTIAREGVRSLMAVPLQTDERVIGMIYVDAVGARRFFTGDDLDLLTVMAYVAGIQIERERWELQRNALISENVSTLERLAAALSHELNSPLGALKSSMDTLARLSARPEAAPGTEEHRLAGLQAGLRRTLDASIERMQQVISRIQRFANLDRAEIQSVNLNELIGDVISLFDASSAERPVGVEFHPAPLPPLACRTQRMSMVFSSLLRNAIDACRQHRGRAGRVQVSTMARGGQVEVQIRDNGPGIPPEELARIFDPGFRVVERRVATGNWSLFSARQMIREHGGDIRITSEPGSGTTLFVTLPCEPSPREVDGERF